MIKTCYERLKQEQTEEIRQLWLDMLITFIKKQKEEMDLNPPMDDIWFGVIQFSVKDTCPDVVKKSAQLLSLLIEYQSKAIKLRGEHIINDCILPLLTHKHTAIRILGIKALYSQLLCTCQGLSNLSELFIKLIHDHSPLVRDTFYSSICQLMIKWSPMNRYTHADQLLPILFSGIADELESIVIVCQNGLKELGHQCSQDLIDAGIMESIDDNNKVNTGLKHIVHQSFDACIKKLMGDSNDFMISKKVTALAALYQFLTYTIEEDMIRKSKWIIQRLMMIIASPTTSTSIETDQLMKSHLDQVIYMIGKKLTWPILLDQLIPRLDQHHLNKESSHLPASVTVTTIADIFITLGEYKNNDNDGNSSDFKIMNHQDKERLKSTLLSSSSFKTYLDEMTYSTLCQLYC
ncbi:unnamed protein product [Cunninghamella blakesleeana]